MKDKLETILGREGISRRDLFKIGFVTAGNLLLPSYGCDKGGGGGPPPDNPTPGNKPPVFNSSFQLSDVKGGVTYSEDISGAATDPDGDSLTYSVSPNGIMTVQNGNTLHWNNPDTDRVITLEALDGKGGKATKDYTLKVINNISGRVLDILSQSGQQVQTPDLTEFNLEELDQNFNLTGRSLPFNNDPNNPNHVNYFINSNGDYVLSRIPTGKRWKVKISHPDYLTHVAGFIDLTRDEAGVDFELIPDDPSRFNLAFFDEVARKRRNQTIRWIQNPRIYINKNDALNSDGSTTPVSAEEINEIKRIIQVEIPKFNPGFSNLIIEEGLLPPATQDYIVWRWNNNFGAALGASFIVPSLANYQDGDQISGASAFARTGLSLNERLHVYTHELTHALGAEGHYDLIDTILHTAQKPGVPPFIEIYQPLDLDLGKILYKRPPGNRSTTEAPDANPDTYRIR